MDFKKQASIFLFLFLSVNSFAQQAVSNVKNVKVGYETYTLDNGLKVIFHIDRSDPVVAVALTSHVGSARELEGKTGFAHLFEHLLFLESENLGKGGLDKLSARVGGSGANGSTSHDRTNYFQTVPNDALEKMIWAQADKLGYFINTVTKPVLAKEKEVVKNEKRQRVDNRPYGHTSYVIDKNLYPAGHPYSWQVIGSLEDLQNATLQDVKNFYNKWYVPNNVILTIAGDFNKNQAKEWIEKYFGGIPRGPEIDPLKKQPVNLSATKKLYYEDNFANAPALTLAWPSVYSYHPDSFALDILANYLSDGKNAPFYKVLVKTKKLAPNIGAYNATSELAGKFVLRVRAYQGTDLDSVYKGVQQAFAKFEKNGISEKDLKRIKAGQERNFYRGLSSVLGKAFKLAQYEIFTGDPGFINKEVDKILGVTTEDVMQVYNEYIKDQDFIATSFVPKGEIALALENSTEALVAEEEIVMGEEQNFDLGKDAVYEKTPSDFDRSVEPPYGETPEIKVPKIWEETLPSGLEIYGITHNEVPLLRFQLEIKGGMLLEDPEKIGVSNLLAVMMTKGTATKTPEQLEAAIELLGAQISVDAQNERMVIRGSALARNFAETMDLVKEILLAPRWDKDAFKLSKHQILSRIKRQKADPSSIASNQFQKLMYGEDHLFSNNILGTEASLKEITMEDLKSYYHEYLSPNLASYMIVGAIEKEKAVAEVKKLSKNWNIKEVEFPELPAPIPPMEAKVCFYDVPGAKQSVLRIGYPALAKTSPDFYPATVMNYRLGGGGFASVLTQELREGKGYTYGIGSAFNGSTRPGPFTIYTGVRTNITLEAVQLIKRILEAYPEDFNKKDLEVTKSYLIKSNARAFETLGAKLGILLNISRYGWSYDYTKQQERIVKNMNVQKIKSLAKKYVDPNRMIYLIVGDADTQLERMGKLGFGKPILLNRNASLPKSTSK